MLLTNREKIKKDQDNPAGPVLSLSLEPLPSGGLVAATAVVVYFHVSPDRQNVPRVFDRNDPGWRKTRLEVDYQPTNDFLNTFQEIKVAGTPFIELVLYDGISMWQFLPSYIWPYFFRSVSLIRALEPVLKDVSPGSIKLFPVKDSSNYIWSKTVRSVAAKYGLPLIPEKKSWFEVLSSPFGSARALLQRHNVTRAVSDLRERCFQWSMRLLGKLILRSGKAAHKKLLFATISRHWIQDLSGTKSYFDEQFYPLLPALRSAGWESFTGIDCPYDSPWTAFYKLLKRMFNGEKQVFWRSFYFYGEKPGQKATRHFREQWRILEQDKGFSRDFSYNGVSLMPVLAPELKRSFENLLPKCAQMLNIAEQILILEKPTMVMLTYETGPFQRALIIAASRLGIPAVGLQHGLIFGNHYDYMHTRVTNNNMTYAAGFSVPGITCVWGQLFLKNLVSYGHYEESYLRVTGNWRLDGLVNKIKALAKNKVKEKFGLSPADKIILILSANQDTGDYIRKVLPTLGEAKGYRLLIKLHPSENPSQVKAILHCMGWPAGMLMEGHLFELLHISDLVISQASTVISEAVLLNKPVVFVDFQKLKGWESYIEAGVCLAASNQSELRVAIDSFLHDPAVLAKMESSRSRFIADYFYKIDGHSAERVAEVAESLLSDGKNNYARK